MLAFVPLLAQAGSQDGGWMAALLGCCFSLCYLVILVGVIAGYWKIFAKAGQPGWAILVPIYSAIVHSWIIGQPWWRWLLYIIPFYGFPYLALVDAYTLVRCFGRGIGFFLGTLFMPFIFIPWLGFGKDLYTPPFHVMAPPPGGRPPTGGQLRR